MAAILVLLVPGGAFAFGNKIDLNYDHGQTTPLLLTVTTQSFFDDEEQVEWRPGTAVLCSFVVDLSEAYDNSKWTVAADTPLHPLEWQGTSSKPSTWSQKLAFDGTSGPITFWIRVPESGVTHLKFTIHHQPVTYTLRHRIAKALPERSKLGGQFAPGGSGVFVRAMDASIEITTQKERYRKGVASGFGSTEKTVLLNGRLREGKRPRAEVVQMVKLDGGGPIVGGAADCRVLGRSRRGLIVDYPRDGFSRTLVGERGEPLTQVLFETSSVGEPMRSHLSLKEIWVYDEWTEEAGLLFAGRATGHELDNQLREAAEVQVAQYRARKLDGPALGSLGIELMEVPKSFGLELVTHDSFLGGTVQWNLGAPLLCVAKINGGAPDQVPTVELSAGSAVLAPFKIYEAGEKIPWTTQVELQASPGGHINWFVKGGPRQELWARSVGKEFTLTLPGTVDTAPVLSSASLARALRKQNGDERPRVPHKMEASTYEWVGSKWQLKAASTVTWKLGPAEGLKATWEHGVSRTSMVKTWSPSMSASPKLSDEWISQQHPFGIGPNGKLWYYETPLSLVEVGADGSPAGVSLHLVPSYSEGKGELFLGKAVRRQEIERQAFAKATFPSRTRHTTTFVDQGPAPPIKETIVRYSKP